jgi:enoyl-CoA hydratase/carnithine racemase
VIRRDSYGRSGIFAKYENLAFTRDDGVLTMRFHTDGGPIVFTGRIHEDLPSALEEVSLDTDNKALVLTGTGDSFMDQIDGPSLGEMFKPAAFEKTRTEGKEILLRLIDLPMPVVAVANGPATVHSEYLLLADIHIASERAVYADYPHPTFAITVGDGMHVAWEEAVGCARAPSGCCGPASASTPRRHCSGVWSARLSRTGVPSSAASKLPAGWPPSRRSTDRCKNKR